MNILYTNFHPHSGGGHDTYIRSLVSYFPKAYVACPASSNLYHSLQKNGHERLCALNFPGRVNECFNIIKSVKALIAIIKQYDIDIVHTNGSSDNRIAIYAALLSRKKIKVVFTKHNGYAIKRKFSQWRLTYLVDALILVSNAVSKSIGFEFNKAKTIVIKNGVDTAYWSSGSSLEHYLLSQQEKPLCFISSAGGADYKGWYLLVNAIKQLSKESRKKLRVVILGYEPSDEEKMRLCGNDWLPDIVTFVGFHADSRAYLIQGDVGFVLSTCSEAISFACREMMSFALPVLISDRGGLPENITNGVEGWLMPVENTAEIEAFLKKSLAIDALSPDDIRRNLLPFKINARRKAQAEFDLKYMCEATAQVYKNLLKQ